MMFLPPDWEFFGDAYRRHLPSIGNGYDFAELLSEMLGELNVSHTGAGYSERHPDADATAALGLYFDPAYDGSGLRVEEVMSKGPLDNARSKVASGGSRLIGSA